MVVMMMPSECASLPGWATGFVNFVLRAVGKWKLSAHHQWHIIHKGNRAPSFGKGSNPFYNRQHLFNCLCRYTTSSYNNTHSRKATTVVSMLFSTSTAALVAAALLPSIGSAAPSTMSKFQKKDLDFDFGQEKYVCLVAECYQVGQC